MPTFMEKARWLARRILRGTSQPEATALAALGPLTDTLSALKQDVLRQPQIDALNRAFSAAPDSTEASADVLAFFSANPSIAALLTSSAVFDAPNEGSPAYHLSVAAAAYAEGRFQRAESAARSALRLLDNEVVRSAHARTIGETQGVNIEMRALEEAVGKHGDSHLLRLHRAELLIAKGDVGAANAAVQAMGAILRSEMADEIEIGIASQKDLDEAISNDRLEAASEQDIYTDDFCRSMWTSYYESYNTRNQRQHGDRLLAHAYLAQVDRIANDVDVVIDFGSMCAQPLFEAAVSHSNIQFYGCDRQQLICDLNNAAYDLPNLHFKAMDIFDLLDEAKDFVGRKAFTHVRTTCVLYPTLVERLYAACAKSGVSRIALIENAGLQRATLRFFRSRRHASNCSSHQAPALHARL